MREYFKREELEMLLEILSKELEILEFRFAYGDLVMSEVNIIG